jgi:hypothetical protein
MRYALLVIELLVIELLVIELCPRLLLAPRLLGEVDGK